MAISACGGSNAPTAPTAADRLDQTVASRFFDFRHAAGDVVDGPRQDAFHEWVLRIEPMVETEAFRRQPNQQSYPVAGSFVSFVVQDKGMPAMLTFFRAGTREDSRAAIDTDL